MATSIALLPGFFRRRRPQAAVAAPAAAFEGPGSLLTRLERWLWQQRQRELVVATAHWITNAWRLSPSGSGNRGAHGRSTDRLPAARVEVVTKDRIG